MFSKPRTVPVTNVGECVPDECAVLQINQEWTIVIQTITHIYCSFHLAIEDWSQPSRGCTNACRINLTDITLPHLLEKFKCYSLHADINVTKLQKLKEACKPILDT